MDFTTRMKIKAVCSILGVALVALPLGAWASDDARVSKTDANGSGEYVLEDVVVTATRSEIPKQDIAANITVLTAEEIDSMPVSTAAAALQYLPGVYVEFNGGPGSIGAARIQGSDFRHVAVYRDGVPLNMLANPMTDLSYLSVDAIERIEVYKGAASSAWGSSLGGVINIITKEPEPEKPFSADVQTSYGEAQTWKSRGNASGTVDRFSYLLSLTHDESDGFFKNTAYSQDAIYAKFNYTFDERSRLGFVYSYDKGRNEDPVLNYPEFWDDIYRRRTYERLLFETSPADNVYLTFEGRHHRFYSKIDDVFADHHEVYKEYLDESWGGSARMTWDINDSNTMTAGFDGNWGEYDFSNHSKKYNTGDWAVYANDTFKVGDFSLNAGVRYDDNKDFGSEISPSVGVVYHISGDDALIRTQVAKGFSAPLAPWVQDPVYGNPNLEPEIAINYQIGGLVLFFKYFQFELNFFQADIDDLIQYDWDAEKYINVNRATRRGVEGEIRADFDFGLALSFNGSYVDVRDKDTDDVIEDIPRTQFNATALYTHKWSTHTLVGKYVDHNSSYPETKDRVFVFDYLLKAELPFPERYGKYTLFAAVHNLFDSDYLYRDVWPQPGRWFEAGVRLMY